MTATKARKIALWAAIAASAALVASCTRIEPPKVVLTGVEFDGISTDGMEFTLVTNVTNVNDFGATIGRLEYSVEVDGSEVASGVRTEAAPVAAGETVEMGIPFTLSWDAAKKGLRRLLDGEEHEWRLRGKAAIAKGGISRIFPFSESGRFRGPSEGAALTPGGRPASERRS
jgi:LEA14-like dessication related protein